MARTPRFGRIEELLGAALGKDLTEELLQRLVEQAIGEAEDLEFKLRYERTDEHRAEIAKDVSALANHLGGVIVLGVAETKGVASKLIPGKDFNDGEVRRIRSIVAERVHPRLNLDIITVPSLNEAGSNYLFVVVPKSRLAPHAVSTPGDPSLRYWVRYGTQTVALGESQIADRYFDRFAAARSRIERLDVLMEEGQRRIATRSTPWVAVGVTPEEAGRFELDAASVGTIGQWVAQQEPLRIGGLTLLSTAYLPVRTC